MKVLVSDTNTGHGNSMRSIILNWCPEATVDVLIDDYYDSVDYAVANGYELMSRSTTGLDDNRLSKGETAYINNVYVVHAHGSNDYELNNIPSRIGTVVSARYASGSYGQGVEFTVTESNSSNATSMIAGMLCKLRHDHSISFDEARQRLRESSTTWESGWTSVNGYHNPNFANAYSQSAQYELDKISNVSTINTANNGAIRWNPFDTSYSVVGIYSTPPTSSTIPTESEIMYYGSGSRYDHEHSTDALIYYSVHSSGSSGISRMFPDHSGSILLYQTGLIKFRNSNDFITRSANRSATDKIIIK